jgi:nicotinamide mononucleotide transporter
MSLEEIVQKFVEGIKATSWLEYIAVFSGIASVWFSRIENILVYPVGLINTIIYIYLSFVNHLPGEASVNLYYTIMSFYGWYIWLKRDTHHEKILHISYLKKYFFPGAIPWADAFASATAFTAMWLMTRKKVESWYWWIATNISSIPLYFVKGLVFTSIYYLVLLVFAFWGLSEWKERVKKARH